MLPAHKCSDNSTFKLYLNFINPVKQKSAIVSQKYGGGYRFLLAEEDVDIAYIKSKATEFFFQNQGKCYFDKGINECEVQLAQQLIF